MKDIKNLKPTEIYVYPKTRNEAIKCFALFEKMGFKNELDYKPCYYSSFYIEENCIRFGRYRHPTLTEISLSELRQMAVVEESKPDELAALKKENEELKAMYKECLEKYVPSEKWDEATNFLSTYGSGLAKDLSEKQI